MKKVETKLRLRRTLLSYNLNNDVNIYLIVFIRVIYILGKTFFLDKLQKFANSLSAQDLRSHYLKHIKNKLQNSHDCDILQSQAKVKSQFGKTKIRSASGNCPIMVLLGKIILKICSSFKGEHPCNSVICQ